MKLPRFFPIIPMLLSAVFAVRAQTDTQSGAGEAAGISFRADPPDDFDVRDSLETILASGDLDDQARYQACYDLLSRRHIAAPATEIAGTEIVEPFILDAWRDDGKQRNTNLSGLYWAISLCWRERGGDDKEIQDARERLWMEKALAAALESENDVYCAIMNHAFGYLEIKRGEVTRAHEYLYEAIKYYDRLERYTMSSEMLYSIGSNFFEIKDVEGMRRVCDQMAEYLKKDTSKQSRYQYNVIRHQYFALLQERERDEKGVADRATVDSAMVYAAANVELVENHIEELSPFWFHGYAYYYLAKELDANYPDRNVEILDALYKALETVEWDLNNTFVGGETAAFSEFMIMANSLLMKALFRTGQTEEARAVLNDTMEQLSEFESFENLNAIRSFIYKFAVEFHQSEGDLAEALRFQKLFTEVEDRAHEREKVRAINEMSAKYETEKKQIRIETLTRENRTARQILWLVVGLALAAVAAGVMVIVWGRLRRRNVE